MESNIFSQLIKKEWADNRKPLLLGVLVVWGTFILMGGFLGSIPTGAGTAIFLFTFFAGLAVSVGSSMAFSNMKSKEGRINALMLPASVSQKYMVRWLAAVPGLLIVVVIGFLLGDLTRILVERINDFSGISICRWIQGNVGNHNDEFRFLFTAVAGTILCAQACYFLGAIVWPKHSFIKTLATLQVLQVVMGIVAVTCRFHFDTTLIDSPDVLISLSWVFIAVVCTSVYWLAYVRFRRSEVIYKLF